MADGEAIPTADGSSPDLAQALMEEADGAGLPLRLLGGTAVWVRCPSARRPPLARPYGDIDLASRAKARARITGFLEAHGYVPDKLFNALHGATRLIFAEEATGRPLDVILDEFTMCHTIDLRDRLELEPLTIPLVDLLLTKLQIVQLNEKDELDILAILLDHVPSDTLDLDRLVALTGSDWGLDHTVRRTLATIRETAAGIGLSAESAATIQTHVDALLAAMDAAPKTVRWRARARVGERVRWYDLPEEPHR